LRIAGQRRHTRGGRAGDIVFSAFGSCHCRSNRSYKRRIENIGQRT
jgi:hypothetical protein